MVQFYEFLNKQHPNIKCTFEKQENYQISFSDIIIKNNGENLFTTIFRKRTTAIGLFTNYLSFTPLSYKNGLVKTLIHRTFKICSNWCLALRKKKKKNSYPKNFIDREVKTYLEKQFNIEPPKFLIL